MIKILFYLEINKYFDRKKLSPKLIYSITLSFADSFVVIVTYFNLLVAEKLLLILTD